MPGARTKGQCRFCHAAYSKMGMTKHLQTCAERRRRGNETRPGSTRQVRLFHLLVAGRHAPEYWMHLEVPAATTLTTLDQFLRDTWLECCGHLSAFRIAGDSYVSSVDREYGFDDRSMRGVKLGAVLGVGDQCIHEYDFGTTTELTLRVVAEREGATTRPVVAVLARNEPPQIACEQCGRAATQVCSQCSYEGAGWLCDACAKTHACGEEMFLPVVNSPRVGMCGYTG